MDDSLSLASHCLIPPLHSSRENSAPAQPQVLPVLPRPELDSELWIDSPPVVSQQPTRPLSPATSSTFRLTLPSIFYLLHIIPYLRVYRLTRGPYIQNNFHGLFLLLWSPNIQLRMVHMRPPWIATGRREFYGWEWAVTRYAVGWYQGIWDEKMGAVWWLNKIIGKKIVTVSEDGKEVEARYVSALDGKDISKLFGTADVPGPAEPWVIAVAEVVALIGVWIPAMCFLSLWSGESNSGLIHAVLNVFALWMDVYYHGYFGGYLGGRMPGPALPLTLLMDRWKSDALKVIIAYGLLKSLCRAIEGTWRGYGIFREGGFEVPAKDEEEFDQGFES
ncbi:hypothetical protein EV426DRAFT_646537 [Tirmania nivea]|nr:hypothetical protein EV426DRAFT_646537 [Tirmania nivea]